MKPHGTVNKYHGRPQKLFQGGSVNTLPILFRFLTMQWKWMFTKRFTPSTPQRKCPMLRQQSQKCASLAAIARYIAIISILLSKTRQRHFETRAANVWELTQKSELNLND